MSGDRGGAGSGGGRGEGRGIGRLSHELGHYAVPILFTALCLFGIVVAKITPAFLLGEMLVRVGRNSILVLSLLIPILAGLGLNFGIVLGAMAGQVAAILAVHWGFSGIGGFAFAMLLATPVAILFGYATGALFNKAKGREMVTGLIAAYFANGIYQLFFLFAIGTLIPFDNPGMVLPQGFGLRNTVDLTPIQYAVDDLWRIRWAMEGTSLRVPVASFAVVAAFCALTLFFFRTRLGQQFRAMGQDPHVAAIAGIHVDRNRLLATILSTVLAAWGQLFFLQNIGTLNTYNSHEQVGMFAIAALLVSGATVSRATVGQALLGTILFHTLFVVSPLAGKALAGDAQIGEYFRVFVAYAVITVALVLHAWQAVRSARAKA
ncbi:MAG TPA: ABC transporter permease [Candidatus Eisenbacteria bacterium]|nr:ABC transporter permease [Candidatus Eisenbacteria bacterium]